MQAFHKMDAKMYGKRGCNMWMKTHLAHSVEKSSYEAKYDANVKEVLSDKQILAKILKFTVNEFANEDEIKIMDCIEGQPEVGTRSVYPGKSERIEGRNIESKVVNEGEVTFDIRFNAITPGSEKVKLIVNIEGQYRYHTGYDFSARGIFYCARMLSEQLDTEFSTDNYNDIKKVYSIWICTMAPEKYANTISKYSLKHEDIHGTFSGTEKYDLLTVVIVRLSAKENAEAGNELHKMLTTLLSHKLTAEARKIKLEKEHNLKFMKELGGMNGMCNLSQGIVENTMMETILSSVDKLMKNLNMPLAKACEALDLTLEDYNEIRELMELEPRWE